MALFNFYMPFACSVTGWAVKGPIPTYMGSDSLIKWQFLFLGWKHSKSSSSALSKNMLL